jgi:outer membrane protein assembly factor BamD (BamD/ComL family)
MRSLPRRLLLGAACVAALAFLASCKSGPVEIPSGLSAAEIFQRAQDASDKGDYALGIRYYSQIQTAYPEDIAHMTWASYEIAFLYHKMGKNDIALSRINELLDMYAKDGANLPPAPRVVAGKLKARLEELTAQKKQ